MSYQTNQKESSTRKKIDLILNNLGWNTDEDSNECNVFTERAKTKEQNKILKGKKPDYVLYKFGTDEPIAIIEAKKKGQNIDKAIKQAIELYAKPLKIKIVFAVDGSFIKTWHLSEKQELKIEESIINDLLPENKILNFIRDGANIKEVSKEVKYSREELIKIFKWANDLLRKEGLRGLDRFLEFSNILFLKLISEIEENKDIVGLEPRILPEKYCWKKFYDLEAEMMMDYINGTVLPYLVSKYNHSGEVFQYKLQIQSSKTLKQIVDKISNLKLLNTEGEIKGDAFEYFLKELSSGNDMGEYFTPRHIVKLMVKLTNPQYGDIVYDPACGTGGFLIEAFRHIKKHTKINKETFKYLREETIYGNELTNTARIAKMNMILIGEGHNNIHQADSLKNPQKNKYDVILANPPYGTTTDYGSFYPIDSRNGDIVFIEHILESMKDGESRCAFIMQEGVLFRSSDLKLRKYILENYRVEAIISLPKGVFLPYTPVKTDILIISKKKPSNKIWCYKVDNDGYELTGLRKKIKNNDFPDLMEKWEHKEEGKKSWTIDLEDIKKNNYALIPEDYDPTLKRTKDSTSSFVKESLNEIISLSENLNKKLKSIKEIYNTNLLDKKKIEKYTLDYLFDLISGGTPPREEKDNFDKGSGLSWVKIGNIQGTTKKGFMLPQAVYINKTDEELSDKGVEKIRGKLIPRGTILTSIFGYVGKTSILNIDAYTNQAIVGLIPKENKKIKLNSKFVYYMLLASRGNLEAMARGGNQKNINKTKLASLEIPIPDEKIQKRIVEFLDNISEELSLAIKIKEELENKLYQLNGDILSDILFKQD